MLKVTVPEAGWAPTTAQRAVKSAQLPEFFEEHAPGPFGPSALSIAVLEALSRAVDTGLAAEEALRGLVLSHLERDAASFSIPELAREHTQFLAAAQMIVTADDAQRRIGSLIALGPVEGELDLDGFPEMLARPDLPAMRAERLLELARAYAQMQSHGDDAPGAAHAAAVVAFLGLARRAALVFSRQSSIRPLVGALGEVGLEVAGYAYDRLEVREIAQRSAGLLPVRPEDIVGNEEYLRAGVRLARDVAAFDLELGRNPKRLNPILFGLGRPGCGKTVTAHAVGNDFLEYCDERDVPAKFVVIQRTDWASSYQNASAMNLVRIFREEVYDFDGVCGVYWPDIDTAFASRDSGSLRAEEKQNLGAVFGVFDGTLLPRDGKWFMLCDANTMHMDEATISRIAQNPMTVKGPTTPAHYATMMRELQLRDVADFLELDDEEWLALGKRALELDLSGRNVDAICGNIRAAIQDFEYPDDYFSATPEGRRAIIEARSKHLGFGDVIGFIDDWSAFRSDADRADEERRFNGEVETIIRRLNASRAAAALTGEA